jgi:hypothetical protein
VQRELRAEDFVFAKIEEEEADADAERGEGAGVAGVMGERHRWMIVKPGCGEKKKIYTPTGSPRNSGQAGQAPGTEAGALRTRRRLKRDGLVAGSRR